MNDYEDIVNSIKESLTIEQVMDYVANLGGEPQEKGDFFISKTICHNHRGEGSHKLYYYANTRLFRCYTQCADAAFDIFDLTTRIKKLEGNKDWGVHDSVLYVASFFNIDIKFKNKNQGFTSIGADWNYLEKQEKLNNIESEQIAEVAYKIYNDTLVENLPAPRIGIWEQEGISPEIIKQFNIRYDPVNQSIIIPHYNINGELIGIRERVLVESDELYGKYKPAHRGKEWFNHPLGFNLYNLNHSQNNIRAIRKAIIFEGEKSNLLYSTYFGYDNDISCSCCGSNITNYQFHLLQELGIEELIIGFDKQFQTIDDDEYKHWTQKLISFHDKFGKEVQISYLFDTEDLLGYKDSPIDKGKETFLKLFANRITL